MEVLLIVLEGIAAAITATLAQMKKNKKKQNR